VHTDRSTIASAPNETIRGPVEGAAEILKPRGQLLGAYTTLDTLGQGGTALVRRARQVVLDRDVAIKTPLLEHLGPESVTRVLQEAWVTGALEHPGVVPVHDVVVDGEGCPHIVMRRIQGHTWTELLNAPSLVEARFGVRDVLAWHLRVLMAVAGTVHHAHERGVLHRDLKPDNVMIGAGGEVYLLDWGIALALDERASRRLPLARHQRSLAGTPHYMAPEMARADGEAFGVRTDVYLLGGLLYAVLAGEPPHPGDDVQAVVDRAAAEVPTPPQSAPARLRQLCSAALALVPADRPPSAEAFRRAVQSWLKERDADALAEAGVAALPALQSAAGAGDAAGIAATFAAVRVSCEQAIVRSPDHPGARTTLDAALTHMVHFELAHGTARAASAWLTELPAPPEALVETVRAAVRAEEARNAAAAQLMADNDPGAGVRTRAFVTVLLGALFTFVPALVGRFDRDPGLADLAVGAAAMLACVLGLWVWARDSLGRSALNRAFIRTTAAIPAIEILPLASAERLGLDAVRAVVLFPLLTGVSCLVMASTLEPFLVTPGLVYLATFVGAASLPALRWEWMAVGNAVPTAVALARWGPDGLRSWRVMRAARARAEREAARGAGAPGGPR
jgi:serine/threonine-protein kinase